MTTYRPVLFGLSIVSLVLGLWLIFWAPDGISFLRSLLGGSLLGLGASQAAIQLWARPKTRLEDMTSPAEASAWISLICVGAITLYLLVNTSTLAASGSGREAGQIGVRLMMILVFWMVISTVIRSRRGSAVLEDERDRAIDARAEAWARGAMTLCLISLVVMLGFSPAEKLRWATPTMLACQLLFVLLSASVVRNAVVVVMYWRARADER